MRDQYTWEIKATSLPLLIKKCSHCNNNRFYCSEKFRLNAQKKNIDVWLIYRCTQCDYTTNMTIFSRVKTCSIDKNLFIKFSENDSEIARKYAFSHEIKQKNNVELDFNSVEYEIYSDDITFTDLMNSNIEVITFNIKYPFDFNLKLTSVIRASLKISSNALAKLIDMEVISVQGKYLNKKQKAKNGHNIKLDVERLKNQSNNLTK